MIQSIKEIINYLYKFKSSFLLISDENEIKGFVSTKEIISLMNSGIDNPEAILHEIPITPLSSIKREDLESFKNFVILFFPSKNIDLLSQRELLYLITGEIKLMEINFQSIIKNLPIPLVITDRYNKILWLNTAFLDLFYLEEEELIGKDITLLITSQTPTLKDKKYNLVISEIIAYDLKVKVFSLLPQDYPSNSINPIF